MRALDFTYDDQKLSDFGFIVCFFGNKGLETISNGSEITFNTSPILYGKKHILTSTEYSDTIQTEFDICLKNCIGKQEKAYIDLDKQRAIMRWLNRKTFHKLYIQDLNEEINSIYYEGSFNVEKVTINERVVGFHLTFICNRPFGIIDRKRKYVITDTEKPIIIQDNSDEIGSQYISAKIVCNETGDLLITNNWNNYSLSIKNCTVGEVISLDYPMITTSLDSHKIQNDFNFNFLQLHNNYDKRVNKFTFSLPCDVEIKYKEIVKVSI